MYECNTLGEPWLLVAAVVCYMPKANEFPQEGYVNYLFENFWKTQKTNLHQ